MIRSLKYFGVLLLACAFTINLSAGNPDRVGSAGASQLLINPWARSSGWGGSNIATVRGLESLYGNVAGLAFTDKTELIFSRSSWIADVPINSFGFSQRMSESSVLALAISSISLADIMITTELLPDGGLGTYSISATNLNVGYSKAFSNSIYGGFVMKAIIEGTSDVTASGIALDAGIQYITGENDHIKFGIALKNVGPTMIFDGDGISFRGQAPDGEYTMTLEQRTNAFELLSFISLIFNKFTNINKGFPNEDKPKNYNIINDMWHENCISFFERIKYALSCQVRSKRCITRNLGNFQ